MRADAATAAWVVMAGATILGYLWIAGRRRYRRTMNPPRHSALHQPPTDIGGPWPSWWVNVADRTPEGPRLWLGDSESDTRPVRLQPCTWCGRACHPDGDWSGGAKWAHLDEDKIGPFDHPADPRPLGVLDSDFLTTMSGHPWPALSHVHLPSGHVVDGQTANRLTAQLLSDKSEGDPLMPEPLIEFHRLLASTVRAERAVAAHIADPATCPRCYTLTTKTCTGKVRGHGGCPGAGVRPMRRIRKIRP